MQFQEFKGAERLVEVVDAAMQAGSEAELTSRIKQGLCTMVKSGALEMPACVCKPATDHYARRLLYRSEEHGYSMVAMTWGPGQGTPLHDHAGLWCVEAVCLGTIRVEQYELAERSGERFRFTHEDDVRASVGTAGCLIPPHEYHTIRNASDEDCAVTLHIYGGDMECCNAFEPEGNGWFRKVKKSLVYDAA
ncbi:MAG TPA: cysteine dioxygenase family protein [Gammaproteobacteria bacterium]